MPQQLPSQPIAFVVTLQQGSSEAEAQVIRSAIRAFAHVATVSPVGSSPALTAAQERARAETEAALTPIWHRVVADVRDRMEAATEEMGGILSQSPEGAPAWQSEVARVPSRNGNGPAGNGHEPSRNGRAVPPQGRSQHAARVPPRAAQRP